MNFITDFIHDEHGFTMVEYGIGGALIVLAVVVAFGGLGTAVKDKIMFLATTAGG